MTLISQQDELVRFCEAVARSEFITVDTEFIRDKTYWPRLCVIQIAGDDDAAAIDVLATGLDIGPVLALLADETLLKVFHAARQDIEIFVHLTGKVPAPVFDTQIAAMVCGFGDSVSYETLVARLAKAKIDKSMRFTDWSHRPLSEKQVNYALADVTHLREIYRKLSRRLEESGRAEWLAEEMAVLTSADTYRTDPQEAWQRLKVRGGRRRFLAILREIAAWREEEAQRRDVPRSRILRDDAIKDIAAHAPETVDDLWRLRSVNRGQVGRQTAEGVIEAVARAKALPEKDCPLPTEPPSGNGGATTELLKVLLKMKCERHHVAQKLVASSADIEALAGDDEADVPALHGWRRDLFGDDALALKRGELGLTASGSKLKLVRIGG